MSRIDDIFVNLRSQRRPGLMPFVTGGFPSLEATEAVLPQLERAGASTVEIGFPFSDPIADGPVIASSMHAALERGVTPRGIFDLLARLRSSLSIGIIGMVSQSIVHRMGLERFCDDAAAAGLDGIIIPDLDLADASETRRCAAARNMSFSMLVAPTTEPQRLRQIVNACSGFVYVVTRVGVTGERETFVMDQLARRIGEIRAIRPLPIAAGFGISTAEQAQQVAREVDAVIVGSAVVRRMGDAGDPVAAAGEFVAELAAGFDGIRA